MANPNPKSLASKAIHGGADVLVALIEEEKTKAAARAQQDLDQTLQHFAQYRESSVAAQADLTRRLKDAEEPTRITKDELVKALSVAAEAKVMTSVAKKEAAEARKELGQIRAALGTVGIVFGTDGTVQWQGERKNTAEAANDGMSSKVQPNAEATMSVIESDPSSFSGESRSSLGENQEVAVNWRDRCRALEKERDGLKEALESETMGYAARILSLQVEVNALKVSCLPPRNGVDPPIFSEPGKYVNLSQELIEPTESFSNSYDPTTLQHVIPSSSTLQSMADAGPLLSAPTSPYFGTTARVSNQTNPSNVIDIGHMDDQKPPSEPHTGSMLSEQSSATVSEVAFNNGHNLQGLNVQLKQPSVSLPSHNSEPKSLEGAILPTDDVKSVLKRPISSTETISEPQSKRNKLQHAAAESNVGIITAPNFSAGGLQGVTALPA